MLKNDIKHLVAIFFLSLAITTSILLWSISNLLAAQINKKLIDASPSYYQKLISELDTSGPAKENVLLQKALLKKLLYFSQKQSETNIKLEPPVDTKGYLDLFERYVSWSRKRSELKKKIEETLKNEKVLKSQIESMAEDDPDLLTLQLQYAFYKKEHEFYLASLKALNEAMEKTPKLLVKALSQITLDKENLPEELQKINAALGNLAAKIQTNRIEVERLSLLDKDGAVQKLKESIKDLEAQRQQLLLEKLKILFLKFSRELQKKEKSVFKTGSEIVALAKNLEQGEELSLDLAQLLENMDALVLGKARTFHGQTLQEIKLLLSKFYQTINSPIFSINGTPVSLLKLSMALIVFTFGFLVGNIYKKNLGKLSLSNRTLTPATRTLMANLGYYAIVTLGFLMGLKVVGIDLSSFALVAGALSVGIGFGLQNIVSNLVSGLILMFERSVKIGDYIEFDENLRGRVTDLRMRSMTITTNANIDVIVPNQDLIQNRVINWTMNDDIRRFDVPFGVAYGTDPQKVMDVVLHAVRNSGFSEIFVSATRRPTVIMTGMGDSSVDFFLRVWIKGPAITRPKRTMSKFLLLIYKTLNEKGIEIPFPQRDLHLRSVDGAIPLHLEKEDPIQKPDTGT